MQIGDIILETPFVAAPMAGVSHPAFRLMARRLGASVVYTEMVSAAGFSRCRKKVYGTARVFPEERPVGLQLFGADPEVMHLAAVKAAGLEIDLVDINMGCPVRKVRRQGAGSALLDDPVRAAEVTAAVVEGAAPLPVTVKLRLGYDRDRLEEILPGILDAGVAAVALHARTVKQGYAGQADWQAIARLAAWCPVPVIGNGDVRSGRDAVRMLAETGCAAVMIGRASQGDPWIFRRAALRLAGREVPQVSLAERQAALWEHVELARRYGGEGHALHFLRKFMMWYTRGLPGASAFRRSAGPLQSVDELWRASQEYFDSLARREMVA